MQLATQVECRPAPPSAPRPGQPTGSGLTVLDPHRTVAVGLILGYGATAVHGWEGFRAGLASVACIFADAPEALVTEKADLRRRVADEYGVPCIALESAISIGFLQEFGVCGQAVEQLRAWIEAGRPLAQAPEPHTSPHTSPGADVRQASQLIGLERQIAKLVAQGKTNVEIARSICLNSRAVDFHVYRLIEKTGSRNRGDLALWITKNGQ